MNDKKKVHNSQLCMKLDPVFTRGYRDGVQITDEPTGALNKSHSIEVLNLLTEINKAGQSILMVIHDLREAVRGNLILYLEDGNIIEERILTSYKTEEEKQREQSVSEWLNKLHCLRKKCSEMEEKRWNIL